LCGHARKQTYNLLPVLSRLFSAIDTQFEIFRALPNSPQGASLC
jgi:hypothetical protein